MIVKPQKIVIMVVVIKWQGAVIAILYTSTASGVYRAFYTYLSLLFSFKINFLM
jgi:hypothetical protein